MKDTFSHRPRKTRYSKPRRHSEEQDVQNGLAVTPQDMLEMVARNEPISSVNLGMSYDEGYGNLEFEPPLQFRRGIDIAELWESQQSSKVKLRTALDRGLVQDASN